MLEFLIFLIALAITSWFLTGSRNYTMTKKQQQDLEEFLKKNPENKSMQAWLNSHMEK
jgi:hypothetical protein